MRPFQGLLDETFGVGAPAVLTSTWPGRSRLRLFAYPGRIKFAKASAKALWDHVADWYAAPPRQDVVLVAHSLGCRLALEFLKLLAGSQRPAGLGRLTLVLMAPAVPVTLVEPAGCLGLCLAAADGFRILHSQFDEALGWVFRGGEWAAGEGWFPQAVGLAGKPFPRDLCDDLSPIGHNGYWRSADAAVAVAQATGVFVRASALSGAVKPTPPVRFGPTHMAPMLPWL